MDERQYLRELAKRVAELAALPEMEQKRKLWIDHNAGKVTTPVIIMETGTFHQDFIVPFKTETPIGQMLENILLTKILNHENICDDKVVSAVVEIQRQIGFKLFDVDYEYHHAKDAEGRSLGYSVEHVVTDLERDLPNLKKSMWYYDKESTQRNLDQANEILGDILPVKPINIANTWTMVTIHAVRLMGMENYFMAMMETPELTREFLKRITDEVIGYIKWQEAEGLLTLNNDDHYAGSGSYGFTDQLPQKDFNGHVRTIDLWGNTNSQESVGISPELYADMVFPNLVRLAELFGLNYYGCCEPVDDILEGSLKNLPRLRKVSISPWCDDVRVGNYLRGTGIVFACKPSPNFVGVDKFDQEGLYNDTVHTLKAASGCALEFSFRDIYSLCGERERAKIAVEIVRKAINEHWNG